MSMPAAWIDALFKRLTLRYGEAFMRQYPDLSAQSLKADWAHVLDGCSATSFQHALAHLSPDRPPNALQFRDLCRGKPTTPAPRLPPPAVDPNCVANALATIRRNAADAAADMRSPAERCRDGLLAIQAERGKLSQVQMDQFDALDRVLALRGKSSADSGWRRLDAAAELSKRVEAAIAANEEGGRP